MRTPAGVRLLLGVVAAGPALAGCSLLDLVIPGKQCKEPPPFYVTVDASDRVNEAHGRSLPTVVQIVQLKDPPPLEIVDPSAWEEPTRLFGDKALAVQELTTVPGRQVKQWVIRHKDANFVVAAVLFREAQGRDSFISVYRLRPASDSRCLDPLSLPLEPERRDEQVHFRLKGYQIELVRQLVAADTSSQGRSET